MNSVGGDSVLQRVATRLVLERGPPSCRPLPDQKVQPIVHAKTL